MQSCLVTNENEKENSCEVEKPSSTLPLSSATTVNHNNSSENCIQVIHHSSLLTSERT